MPYIKNFVNDNNEKNILNKIKEIKFDGIEMVNKYNMINCFNKEFEIIENVCSYNIPTLNVGTMSAYITSASPYVLYSGQEYMVWNRLWSEPPNAYNDLPPI